MKNLLPGISLLFLGLLTLTSCSSKYPDGIVEPLYEEFQTCSVSYYSPSMLQSAMKFDSTGTIADILDGIYDIKVLSFEPSEYDSTTAVTAIEIAERIDQQNLNSVFPSTYTQGSSLQLLTRDSEHLQIVFIVIHNDPELSVYEMRGDDLKSNIASLIFAMMSGKSPNLPFLP